MKQADVINSNQSRKVSLDWLVIYELGTKAKNIWEWVYQTEHAPVQGALGKSPV